MGRVELHLQQAWSKVHLGRRKPWLGELYVTLGLYETEV